VVIDRRGAAGGTSIPPRICSAVTLCLHNPPSLGEWVSTAAPTRAEVEFDRVYPWAVKSRRQSELLNEWLQLRTKDGVPPQLSDFAGALRRYPDQDELTIYDVVRDSALARYLIVKEGFAFKKAFGTTGTGRFLDDVLPPLSWRMTRPNYDTCTQLKLPVYVAFSTVERDEEKIIYERLLLPFASEMGIIEGLLSSLKTTTWKDPSLIGAEPGAREPKYSFRAVIGLD
jgi:hypothetical protein